MKKLTLFSAVALSVLIGFVITAAPAHAEGDAVIGAKEATILKNALDVLQELLNQIRGQLAVNAIPDYQKPVVSAALDGTKGVLISLDSAITSRRLALANEGREQPSPYAAGKAPQESPTIQNVPVNVPAAVNPPSNEYTVPPPPVNRQTAALQNIDWRKVLPIVILAIVAVGLVLYLRRRGGGEEDAAISLPGPPVEPSSGQKSFDATLVG